MSALMYRCPGCGFRVMTSRLCGSCKERFDRGEECGKATVTAGGQSMTWCRLPVGHQGNHSPALPPADDPDGGRRGD